MSVPAAALALLLCLAAGAARADAAPVVTAVPGHVEAIALSGDAVVVALRPQGPEGRTLVIERRPPGSAPAVLLRTRLEDDDDEVSLAASADAVAVSLTADDPRRDTRSTRVLVGPATGPLRQVAGCEAALLALPVAVDGARIAWGEGGCGLPPRAPRESGPAALAEGTADPAAPVARAALEEGALPGPVALGGGRGVAAVLRPTFFGFVRSDVREVTPSGFGRVLAREASGLLVPVGILPDGSTVLARQAFDESDLAEEETEREGCVTRVASVAPGGGPDRPIDLGGCPGGDDEDEDVLPGESAVVAGDRVLALVRERGRRSTAVVSVAADGADRRVLSRGTFRRPLGIAAAGGRTAWWQPRCSGGAEIVTSEAVPGLAPRGPWPPAGPSS